MNLLPSNHYRAFDGQVTFETEPYITPLAHITIERIEAAIPEHKTFGLFERRFFDDFREFMAFTANITFDLKENAPMQLQRLKVFWEQASVPQRDYQLLWQLFLRTYEPDMIEPEWNKAINITVPPQVAADPALATSLPEDEEELENLPDDSPLSEPGKPSIKKSSGSSSKNKRQAELPQV